MAGEQPLAQLMRMVNGYQVSQAIHVAVSLGIADLLADGARPSDELAVACGAHPQPLYRVLRALAAAGVLHEDDERRFSLTEVGAPLRTDHPQTIAPWAALMGRAYFQEAWSHLLDGVRTGETPFVALHGESVWSYRGSLPEENAAFNQAMGAISNIAIGPLLAAYDFSKFGTIVDVGGGNGTLLAAILRQATRSRGIVFDLPHVVEGAGDVLRAAGVADRCETAAGSMFDSVPAGGDAYVMKNILHDYEDGPCEQILAGVRRAMGEDARLIVLERIVGPPNGDLATKLSDLNMFVLPAGRERTEDEWASLFARTGFRLSSITRTAGTTHVIEAVPA
jgi:hypothetical protein